MNTKLAFDRASVRTVDADGRLHVAITNISKANVCEYYGREIPNGEALGLEPDKMYKLLRDPAELEKAAPTFNNIPVLSMHVPVHVEEPQKDLVIGSTGTDAVFAAPYLQNSLVFWTADAISAIESGEQKELSCCYRYIADMTPGTFDGTLYDGVMREIRGNHVALVETGRAGPDVFVGDSKPVGDSQMKKQALSNTAMMARGGLMALASCFAADAAIDFQKLLSGLTAKNIKAKKAGLVGTLKQKLAKDASIDDVVSMLDKLEEIAEENPGMDEPATEEKEGVSVDGEGLSDEEEAQFQSLSKRRKPAADEPPEFKGKPEVGGGKEGKPAMDAAAVKREIKLAEDATVARINAMHQALSDVKPYVGVLTAQDSADSVYAAALKTMGIDTDGIHPSAFRAVLMAQPKPDSSKPLALDSASTKGFAEKFGSVAGRVQQL